MKFLELFRLSSLRDRAAARLDQGLRSGLGPTFPGLKAVRGGIAKRGQIEPPFLGYDGGNPVICSPYMRSQIELEMLPEAGLEKLIVDAAFEAKRLNDATYFHLAMDRVETAIRCAQHILDHVEPRKE